MTYIVCMYPLTWRKTFDIPWQHAHSHAHLPLCAQATPDFHRSWKFHDIIMYLKYTRVLQKIAWQHARLPLCAQATVGCSATAWLSHVLKVSQKQHRTCAMVKATAVGAATQWLSHVLKVSQYCTQDFIDICEVHSSQLSGNTHKVSRGSSWLPRLSHFTSLESFTTT